MNHAALANMHNIYSTVSALAGSATSLYTDLCNNPHSYAGTILFVLTLF